MTVKEIVIKYLEENGFEGLVCWNTSWDGCGCGIEDLMPCDGECIDRCEPAYKVPCTGEDCEYGGDCKYHLTTEKPDKRWVNKEIKKREEGGEK
jgi:hypothetical protein